MDNPFKDPLQTFLSRAIDPPDIAAVDKALEVLEELAAIGSDGELTALGRHMVGVPSIEVDVPLEHHDARLCCPWISAWERYVASFFYRIRDI